MHAKHVWFSVMLVVVLVITAIQPASAATVVPSSMASLGDSISRGYNTGGLFTDAPANAWSTGTNTRVNSLYLRFYSLNPAIQNQNYNWAVSGAKMVDLNTQAARVTGTIQYVTILMGANDVCAASETAMTPVETFRTQFRTALTTIKTRSPNATIYVVSIPNVYNLWYVLKGSSSARFTWSLYRICQSMLKNPTSTQAVDVARRDRVRQRNIDFNTVLYQECAAVSGCAFDSNAVYNTTFIPSDVSTRDYFHPSLAGQTKVANVAWSAAP